MKEIVNEILKEEEKARKIIEQTKTEAQNLITAADKDSRDFLEKSHSELRNLIIQKQTEAAQKFLSEKEKILLIAREENTVLRKSREKDIPAIAKSVFLRLIDMKG